VRLFLQQLVEHIRPSDVLDVAVIAVLLYLGLNWFRQRASRSTVVGLTLIAAVFFCAHWFGMYLTTVLFKAGFIVVLMALIVVFQQDIRRAFERVSAWNWFQRLREPLPSDATIETLTESITRMAHDRIGALIVLAGREPLDAHVRGGVRVDGEISLPLLYSIFHPQSPGHDGAVLIQSQRLHKLGVHLPLSRNYMQLGGRGTRHAAALGLAEVCDASVIVVSEERGTISIAEQGRLLATTPDELPARLQQYYQRHCGPASRTHWHRHVTHNFQWKLAALATSCLLWLLFSYHVETIQRTFIVPIEYRNLPDSWVVDEPRINRAEVTLSGPERGFNLLDADALVVSFDLQNVRPDSYTALRTADNLKGAPPDLVIDRIDPREVFISLRRKSSGT
jgi:uncharacterized protein (TIGR00159 family)